MMTYSPKLLIPVFFTIALLFTGCKTRPVPTPQKTVTSGIGSHEGWVDTDTVDAYGGGSGSVAYDGDSGGIGYSDSSGSLGYGSGSSSSYGGSANGYGGGASNGLSNTSGSGSSGTLELRDSLTGTSKTTSSEQRDFLPTIYFGFDQSGITGSERTKVERAADYLKQNPQSRLRIEGNCDWRGTAQYNLALGDRRANSIKEFLTLLGVESSRIDILSYGDQFSTAQGSAEQMRKDRRADLVVLTR